MIVDAEAGARAWTETVVKLVGPFAQLSSPTGEADATPLRVMLSLIHI